MVKLIKVLYRDYQRGKYAHAKSWQYFGSVMSEGLRLDRQCPECRDYTKIERLVVKANRYGKLIGY